MPTPDKSSIGFVRALVRGGRAAAHGRYFVVSGANPAKLDDSKVESLISSGVLAGNAVECWARPEAAAWLRRQLLDKEAFAAQHRVEVELEDGRAINLAESPLARLAAPDRRGGAAFLERHQVEAGERIRRLVERAALQPRMTLSYSFAGAPGARNRGNPAGDIGDLAADARKQLAEAMTILPADCAVAVLDICGFLKGLQQVEQERGWPRRSAKLVLRIGLDQLACHFGLSREARGANSGRTRNWMDEGGRPGIWE